jgi:hypothetical protein
MAVGGIDHDHIDAGLGQQFDALLGALADADRGADAQVPLLVFAGQGVLAGLEDVLDGHQAAQLEAGIDHQHALQAMLVHQGLGFLGRAAFADRDEPVARCHDVAYRLIQVGLETGVPVGDDAHHDAVIHHRQAGNAIAARQGEHFAHAHGRRHGDRVLQHAGFETLDLGHFGGLCLGVEVLVHDADAAFLGQGDGQAGFRHRVHGGGKQRQVELDLAGKAGSEADVAGEDRRVGGYQEDVVKRQRLLEQSHSSFP